MKGKQRMRWLPMACLMLVLGVMSMANPSKAASEDDFRYVYCGGDDGDSYYDITGYNGNAEEVIIPSTYEGIPVREIDYAAFENCSNLKSVVIPASVIYIGSFAFKGCDLEKITVDADNPKYYSEGNCLIERSSGTLIQGCNTSMIPNTVTSIGGGCIYRLQESGEYNDTRYGNKHWRGCIYRLQESGEYNDTRFCDNYST